MTRQAQKAVLQLLEVRSVILAEAPGDRARIGRWIPPGFGLTNGGALRYAYKQKKIGSFSNVTTVLPPKGLAGIIPSTFQSERNYADPEPLPSDSKMVIPPHNFRFSKGSPLHGKAYCRWTWEYWAP
jgi:hypothetical protein